MLLMVAQTDCHSSLEDETNLSVRTEDWPERSSSSLFIRVMLPGWPQSLPAISIYWFIIVMKLWSLTPSFSGDQITRPNQVSPGPRPAHNYGSLLPTIIWLHSAQHTSSLLSSLICDDRNWSDLLCLWSPPHSLHYLPARENMSAKFQ